MLNITVIPKSIAMAAVLSVSAVLVLVGADAVTMDTAARGVARGVAVTLARGV